MEIWAAEFWKLVLQMMMTMMMMVSVFRSALSLHGQPVNQNPAPPHLPSRTPVSIQPPELSGNPGGLTTESRTVTESAAWHMVELLPLRHLLRRPDSWRI